MFMLAQIRFFFFNMYFGFTSKTKIDSPDSQGSELLCSSSSRVLKDIRKSSKAEISFYRQFSSLSPSVSSYIRIV